MDNLIDFKYNKNVNKMDKVKLNALLIKKRGDIMLVQKPPMGWNSWNCFGPTVTEQIIKETADYMSDNLSEFGWEYIVIDGHWYEPNATSHMPNNFVQLEMDKYGRLLPTTNRYPTAKNGNGFKEVSRYIHLLGLKFGIHIMRGVPRQAVHADLKIKGTNISLRDIVDTKSICPWNTDMYGIDASKEGAQEYYNSLFELYANWNVDFIKADDLLNYYNIGEIRLIEKAIKNCGRKMVFSLSPGPAPLEQAEELKQVCDMWRISNDFWDYYGYLYEMFAHAEKWSTHAGPGHWPDADMLALGALRQNEQDKPKWSKFTKGEVRMMMALWSILRSPLMIGADIRKNDNFCLEILTNGRLINMNQNSHGAHQVYRRVINQCEIIAWTAYHTNGTRYLAIFNVSENNFKGELDKTEFELPNKILGYEIFSGKSLSTGSSLNLEIKSHDVFLLEILPNKYL